MQWLTDKVPDLEDRSRRNNLKLWGVPETVTPPELIPLHSGSTEITLARGEPYQLYH